MNNINGIEPVKFRYRQYSLDEEKMCFGLLMPSNCSYSRNFCFIHLFLNKNRCKTFSCFQQQKIYAADKKRHFSKNHVFTTFCLWKTRWKGVKNILKPAFSVEKYVENVKKALINNQKRGFLCNQKQKPFP